jgi:hypothetical protein
MTDKEKEVYLILNGWTKVLDYPSAFYFLEPKSKVMFLLDHAYRIETNGNFIVFN